MAVDDPVVADDPALLQRIEACDGPPESTFDGKLHRWREERAEHRATVTPPPAGTEHLETAWNGTMGRQGKALTEGKGLGSSLGPGSLAVLRT